jgi:hypothetical protein
MPRPEPHPKAIREIRKLTMILASVSGLISIPLNIILKYP